MLGQNYTVKNFGVSGSTLSNRVGSSYRKKPPFRESIKYQPAIVIIKLGTNDSKPKNWIHKDHYIEDYISLINTYKKLSSSPQIWICYSVPAYPGRWGISDEVIRTELQPMLDEIAAQTDTKIIDLYSALSNKKGL
ncbi:MAG: hypothetical protein HRT88_10170, partial [Lentisphaeraceae bacterium]|nr:hypothetical protein [Lentisphaeraceae bacterium]